MHANGVTRTGLAVIGLLITVLGPVWASPDVAAAYNHLNSVMDQFHAGLDVYTDADAGGNHFIVLALMGSRYDILDFDSRSTENPDRNGEHCLKVTFTPVGSSWAGLYFMNGVLPCGTGEPAPNWGDYPDAGVDLRGAAQLSFRAKGAEGGERVEFFMGGIGRDPWSGNPTEPYPDSAVRTPPIGYVYTLSSDWQEITIDLSGVSLNSVLGGFGFVLSSAENPTGATFYLDDIRYDRSRLDDPRFLQSYRGASPDHWLDDPIRNSAFVYDNSVTILSYLLRGTPDDVRRAGLIADALVYAQDHDRFYDDGGLRTAYQAGDLVIPAGWTPNCRATVTRLPGWWGSDEQWHEDPRQTGTATGAMAWTMLALSAYAERLEEDGQSGQAATYVAASERLGEWVEANCRDDRGAGGYTGGFLGPDEAPVRIETKSTEENLSLYAAFRQLALVTGDASWQERAQHAREFVDAMWDEVGGLFWAATLEDGTTPNYEVLTLDANIYPLLVFGDGDRYRRAVNWARSNLNASASVGSEVLNGFDYNTDRDGIWWEGTASMVEALYSLGDWESGDSYANQLGACQLGHPAGDSAGIMAASPDGVSTGWEDWEIPERLHIGATGWMIMAASRHNPFWRGGQIFRDVPPSYWAFDEINACVAEGIVRGYEDGTYRPADPVTRDQMAVYIARALAGGDDNVPPGSAYPVPSFIDVPGDHWAYNYIEYAAANNVVEGFEDGSYQPDVEVTRDQMAVYIARSIVTPTGEAGLEGYEPPAEPTFPDVASGFWAYKHIEYCVQENVVRGYEDGSYHPEVVVTRDQMAVYIARAFALAL